MNEDSPEFIQPRLAINGGVATFPDGPPPWPDVGTLSADLRAVLNEVADDGSWAAYDGAHTELLIARIGQLTNQPYVRLCSSGTVAVELALRSLGVGAGDEVILGGYDFPGNFRAIEACGAQPVLVDLEPMTGCIDATQLDAARSTITRCVIASHLHSGLAGMHAIMDWGNRNNVSVVEDACQAPGATVDAQPAGSWGDASVLSFGGSKLLTAGRGGAVACRRPECFQRMKVFADRGNDAYPMSQLQAAVLPVQLDVLAARNGDRQKNAKRICEALENVDGLNPIWTFSNTQLPAVYKLGIWLCPNSFSELSRDRWITAAQAEGIAIDRGFRGFVHRSERRCRKSGELTNAQRASDFGVVLHHPILLGDRDTIDELCDAMERVTQATRSEN